MNYSRQIYFDGFLPTDKFPTRMSRMIKNTSQISSLFSSNPSGCIASHISPFNEKHNVQLFKVGATEIKSLVTPTFLVPCVIDALRACPQYADLVKLVPGEADNYCATDVKTNGGVVFTSDSDLLAQNLENGQVAFLRDIHRDDAGAVVSAVFDMDAVLRRLGLNGAKDAPRFAYERKQSPQASVQVLVKSCKSDIGNAKDYESFLRQYQDEDNTLKRLTPLNPDITSIRLDPRPAETFFQMLLDKSCSQNSTIRMFMPVLVESDQRGTAWEPTTSIRQLAYSVMKHSLSSPVSGFQEYRKVHSLSQKGRNVELLSKEEMVAKANQLSNIARRLKQLLSGKSSPMLPLLSLSLDIIDCHSNGKNSHVLKMLQGNVPETLTAKFRVPWELIHFVAHIQAGLYSFRILKQVLDIDTAGEYKNKPWGEFRQLIKALVSFEGFPDIADAPVFFAAENKKAIYTILTEFSDLDKNSIQGLLPENKKRKGQPVKQQENNRPQKKQSKPPPAALKNNRFGSLLLDE